MSAFISEEEAKRQVQDLLAEPPPPPKPHLRFRARVPARLGKGGKPRDAIVTIDKALTVRIRPFRGKISYDMSLEQAVAWLMQKLVVPDSVGKPRKRRRS